MIHVQEFCIAGLGRLFRRQTLRNEKIEHSDFLESQRCYRIFLVVFEKEILAQSAYRFAMAFGFEMVESESGVWSIIDGISFLKGAVGSKGFMENIVVLATDQYFGVDVEQRLEDRDRASTASGTDDE